MKTLHLCYCLLAIISMPLISTAAPTNMNSKTESDKLLEKANSRQGKALNYYDYLQQGSELDYTGADAYEESDYDALNYDQNELGRTLPKRNKLRRPQYNSPIYYIRLPPQPYMFVPGFGYVPQPPAQNPVQQFLNVPVSFVSNGKPANIYQWSGIQQFPSSLSRPQSHTATNRPSTQPDSTIHRLPGEFAFNGKPEDIFVLRNSYNSLYSDALQNLYP